MQFNSPCKLRVHPWYPHVAKSQYSITISVIKHSCPHSLYSPHPLVLKHMLKVLFAICLWCACSLLYFHVEWHLWQLSQQVWLSRLLSLSFLVTLFLSLLPTLSVSLLPLTTSIFFLLSLSFSPILSLLNLSGPWLSPLCSPQEQEAGLPWCWTGSPGCRWIWETGWRWRPWPHKGATAALTGSAASCFSSVTRAGPGSSTGRTTELGWVLFGGGGQCQIRCKPL